MQFHDHDFGSIVEADRNNTVANSPADDHSRVDFGEKTCIILREETLIGGHQTADERQAKLAAMGMAGEYQIHSGIDIYIEQLRPVR